MRHAHFQNNIRRVQRELQHANTAGPAHNQVRRLLAIDQNGKIVGIISQADIALNVSEHETAEVLKEVSQPSEHAAMT